MNVSYKHLTLFERESIMMMHSQRKTQTDIARTLNRSMSTISRELKRHTLSEYRASLAQTSYQENRKKCKAEPKLKQEVYRQLVQTKVLNEGWSPEQLGHRLALEKSDLSISTTRFIERFIKVGLMLGSIKPAKNYDIKAKIDRAKITTRGEIPISHTLATRPISAQNRSRFGHWEADTVLGKQGGACLVTLTERKSRFELAHKIPAKQSHWVAAAIAYLLASHKVRSITPDRGKEFAKHELVTTMLDAEFYFPEPYQPWQRGINENMNGLLREYFPKQQDMNQWSNEDIQSVVDKLNLRPRKCLGWKIPYEVYFAKSLHLV